MQHEAEWLDTAEAARCDPATRAIWRDLLKAMAECGSESEITDDKEALARLGRCSVAQLTQALDRLAQLQIAEVVLLNGAVRVSSKRAANEQLKQQTLSKIRAKSGALGGKRTAAKLKSVAFASEREFLEFWGCYPRKVGKGYAWLSWLKIPDRVALLPAMLKTLEWQKRTRQWQDDNGRYIPHPATWLNQRRWEDAPTVTLSQSSAEAHKLAWKQKPKPAS